VLTERSELTSTLKPQAYLDCSVEARRVCLGLLAGSQSGAAGHAFGPDGAAAAAAAAVAGAAAAAAGAGAAAATPRWSGIDAMLSGSVDTYAALLHRHTAMLEEEKARLIASYR
jgi:hypothetical protein